MTSSKSGVCPLACVLLTCTFVGFTESIVNYYSLLFDNRLDDPRTPAAPHIAPADVAENTPFNVTSSGYNGHCTGHMELVSSVLLDGFKFDPIGCGASAPICYSLSRSVQPIEHIITGGFEADLTWTISLANQSADGIALWCRAVNVYSSKPPPLSATSTTLRVLCVSCTSYASSFVRFDFLL